MKILSFKIVFLGLLILFQWSCKKENIEKNALVLKSIKSKTTLKNHTTGVDYIINSKELIINAELIIESGVEIQLEQDATIKLLDNGSLICQGSDKNPIEFNAKPNQTWQGIQISSSKVNELKHVNIQQIKSEEMVAAIELLGHSSLKVEHSTFETSSNQAAFFVSEKSQLNLEPNCTFKSCLAPVQIELGAEIKAKQWILNHVKINGVLVQNKNKSAFLITQNTTIKYSPFAYYFMESVVVDNCQLTIDAGVKIKMSHRGKFETASQNNSNTAFLLRGSSSNPISIDSQDPKFPWSGFILLEGNSNFIHTYFRNIEHSDTNFGAITLLQKGNANFFNCDFRFNKTKCSIIILNRDCRINQNAFNVNVLYNNGICHKY